MFTKEEVKQEDYYSIDKEDYYNECITEGSKVILLEPRVVSEVKQIADYLKNRYSLIISLNKLEKSDARELIDFLSGTIYVLNGTLENLTNNVFLLTPNNVNVEGKINKERERID